MDSNSTWLKHFNGGGDNCGDDKIISISDLDHKNASSDIEKAAESITLLEERRYINSVGDIDQCLPTEYTNSYWLQCHSGCTTMQNISAATSSVMQQLLETHKGLKQADVNHDFLIRRAIECNFTIGKWMLKASKEHVNEIWRCLATNMLSNDKLLVSYGVDSIKCSSQRQAKEKDDELYTICIYTNDGLANKDGVMEIRDLLNEIGVDRKCIFPLFYKPDMYTFIQLSGATYVWIDGRDTKYWFNHWDGNKQLY